MKMKAAFIAAVLASVAAGYAAGTMGGSTEAGHTFVNRHNGGSAGESTQAKSAHQPYAGLQARTIKALSPQEAEQLRSGRGAGYALAAELNHYPGPKHVSEFAAELKLTEEQSAAVTAQIAKMEAEAKALGEEMLRLEAELDRQFREGRITQPTLAALTNDIAVAEGKLRYTHLKYHLETKRILTEEQVSKYDELRGYK